MKVTAALGGNALRQRGEPADSGIQESHVARAAAALAPLLCDHQLVVTHGNPPQAGMLARESASDPVLSGPYPFGVLGGHTQGMIGYWLVRALETASPGHRAGRLFGRTLVKADDPGFSRPPRFVSPVVYEEAEARGWPSQRGWHFRPESSSWRRVVPSPEPAALAELDMIETLASQGVTMACARGRRHPSRPAFPGDHGCAAAEPDPVGGLPGRRDGPKVEAACGFATADGGIAASGG